MTCCNGQNQTTHGHSLKFVRNCSGAVHPLCVVDEVDDLNARLVASNCSCLLLQKQRLCDWCLFLWCRRVGNKYPHGHIVAATFVPESLWGDFLLSSCQESVFISKFCRTTDIFIKRVNTQAYVGSICHSRADIASPFLRQGYRLDCLFCCNVRMRHFSVQIRNVQTPGGSGSEARDTEFSFVLWMWARLQCRLTMNTWCRSVFVLFWYSCCISVNI